MTARVARIACAARVAVALFALAALPHLASAQQIQIDRGLRAGGLWCFPLVTEPKTYVYLPSSARLATDDAGRPQFSFVRYVTTAEAGSGQESIRAAGGGGILHFLVLMETPESAVTNAARALREKVKDEDV